MGLDMFAYKVKAELLENDKQVDIDIENIPKEDFYYWRKHHDLHGWMENLYRFKGGKDEVFNCSTIVLTLDDLNMLSNDIKNYGLPNTKGFFFGNNSPDEESNRQDLDFVWECRAAIDQGYVVFFFSGW